MRFEDIKNYGVNFTDNTDFKQFGVSDDANKKFLVFEEFKKHLKEQGIELDDKQIMEILNSNVATENLTDVFNKILNFGNTVKNDVDESAVTNNQSDPEVQAQEESGGSNFCETVDLRSSTPVKPQGASMLKKDVIKLDENGVEGEVTDDDGCYEAKFHADVVSMYDLENSGSRDSKIKFIAEQQARNEFLYDGKLHSADDLDVWAEGEGASIIKKKIEEMQTWSEQQIDETVKAERERCVAEHRALNEFMFAGTGDPKSFFDWLKLPENGYYDKDNNYIKGRNDYINDYKTSISEYQGSLSDYILEIDAATYISTTFSDIQKDINRDRDTYNRDRDTYKFDYIKVQIEKEFWSTDVQSDAENIVNEMILDPNNSNWGKIGDWAKYKDFIIDSSIRESIQKFADENNTDYNTIYRMYYSETDSPEYENNPIFKELKTQTFFQKRANNPNWKNEANFVKSIPTNIAIGSEKGEISLHKTKMYESMSPEEKAAYENSSSDEKLNFEKAHIEKGLKDGTITSDEIFEYLISTLKNQDKKSRDMLFEIINEHPEIKENAELYKGDLFWLSTMYTGSVNASKITTAATKLPLEGDRDLAQRNIVKSRTDAQVRDTHNIFAQNHHLFSQKSNEAELRDSMHRPLSEDDAKEVANATKKCMPQHYQNYMAQESTNLDNSKLQDIYFNTAVENNAETAKYVTENGILAKLHKENQAKAYETTHNAFESGMSPEEAREWNSKLYNQVSTLSPEAQHTIASNPEYAQEFTNYTVNAVAQDKVLQGLLSIQPNAVIPKTDKEIFREHWEAMTPTERYNFICNISLKNFSKLSPALRKRILEHAKNDPVFMKNLVKRYGLDLLKNQLFPDALSIIVRELFNDPSERVKVAREVCNDSNRYPASLVEDCQLILAEHYGIDESSFEQLSGMEKRQVLQAPNRADLASIGAQSGTNRNNLPDYSNDYFKKKSNLNGLV